MLMQEISNSWFWSNSTSMGIVSIGNIEPQTLSISLNYYDLNTLVIDAEKGILTIKEKKKE